MHEKTNEEIPIENFIVRTIMMENSGLQEH